MKELEKHLGFLLRLEDFRFKQWLDGHAQECLEDTGVKSGQIVLDYGCGSGRYTIAAARIVGESGLVYALDVDRKASDKIKKRADLEGLKNIVGIDACDFDVELQDASIDHVLLIDVLQEIDDRMALFGRIQRILKPQGTMIVYPMHIADEEIIKLASEKAFVVKEKRFDDRILIFRCTQKTIDDN